MTDLARRIASRGGRGTSRALVLAAGLALLAWLAAPAISLERYSPAPEDFSERIGPVERITKSAAELLPPAANHEAGERTAQEGDDGDAAHAGHGHGEELGPVRFLTHVVEAPGRFDVVGLAGEMREIELRVRLSGGGWTEWFAIAQGDPLFAEGGEAVQARARGFRPRGRFHFVNVTGDRTRAQGIVNTVRATINQGIVTAGALVGADPASAQGTSGPPSPRIVKRRAWGANDPDGGCRPRSRPAIGKMRATVVHHTVSATEYDREAAPRMVLGICRFHRNGNGWNDIGYNALVDRFGRIYAGRAGGLRRAIVGAHAVGFNAETWGIASLGTHTSVRPTKRTLRGFRQLIAWRLGVDGIRRTNSKVRLTSAGGAGNPHSRGSRVRTGRIVPHGGLTQTACPGDAFRGRLRALRRQTNKLLRRHPPESPSQPPAGTDPDEEYAPPEGGLGSGGLTG